VAQSEANAAADREAARAEELATLLAIAQRERDEALAAARVPAPGDAPAADEATPAAAPPAVPSGTSSPAPHGEG